MLLSIIVAFFFLPIFIKYFKIADKDFTSHSNLHFGHGHVIHLLRNCHLIELILKSILISNGNFIIFFINHNDNLLLLIWTSSFASILLMFYLVIIFFLSYEYNFFLLIFLFLFFFLTFCFCVFFSFEKSTKKALLRF